MKTELSRRSLVTQPLPDSRFKLFAALSTEQDGYKDFFTDLIKKSRPASVYEDENIWVGQTYGLPSEHGTTVRFICVTHAKENYPLKEGNYLEIVAPGGVEEIEHRLHNIVNATADFVGDTVGTIGDDAKPDLDRVFYLKRVLPKEASFFAQIQHLNPSQKQEVKKHLARKEVPMITVNPDKAPAPLPRVYPWGYNKRFIYS